MKALLQKLVFLILTIAILIGCQKNQDYVETTTTPLNLFIRLDLSEEEIIENAFGAICTSENQELILISNKQELLLADIDINVLESGDFILARQIQGSSQNFSCIYIHEYTSGENTVISILTDEIPQLDSFVVEGNLVTGSHEGSFNSSDGQEIQYSLNFSCGLMTNNAICE